MTIGKSSTTGFRWKGRVEEEDKKNETRSFQHLQLPRTPTTPAVVVATSSKSPITPALTATDAVSTTSLPYDQSPAVFYQRPDEEMLDQEPWEGDNSFTKVTSSKKKRRENRKRPREDEDPQDGCAKPASSVAALNKRNTLPFKLSILPPRLSIAHSLADRIRVQTIHVPVAPSTHETVVELPLLTNTGDASSPTSSIRDAVVKDVRLGFSCPAGSESEASVVLTLSLHRILPEAEDTPSTKPSAVAEHSFYLSQASTTAMSINIPIPDGFRLHATARPQGAASEKHLAQPNKKRSSKKKQEEIPDVNTGISVSLSISYVVDVPPTNDIFCSGISHKKKGKSPKKQEDSVKAESGRLKVYVQKNNDSSVAGRFVPVATAEQGSKEILESLAGCKWGSNDVAAASAQPSPIVRTNAPSTKLSGNVASGPKVGFDLDMLPSPAIKPADSTTMPQQKRSTSARAMSIASSLPELIPAYIPGGDDET